ncbi:MAG: peptidase [Gemmatimonadetes bacterium]|nr:peptidase [Gemmatimonadota bacterium]MBI93377.1 peptidase [Gemmatimonadaceae bacterium]MBU08447.1 peptidase [Gemmatimonadota bacterium]
MYSLDSTILLLIPCMILALWAQHRVKSTYTKFSQVGSAAQITGAEVARRLLQQNRIVDVAVEETSGVLTDHYDPRSKVVRLSSDIFHGRHLAGLAVAAHEVGHAVQHAHGYFALNLRHAFLPVANLGSMAAFPLFFIGFFFTGSTFLVDLGIALYAGVVAFQVITLPVEFNASSRAMAQLVDGRYLAPQEGVLAKKVLNAAALTYVAATATALMHLVRLVILRQGMRD